MSAALGRTLVFAVAALGVAALAAGCAGGQKRLAPGAPEVIQDGSGIPVAMSPASLLVPGAVRAITVVLAERGLLPRDHVGDKLDDAAMHALGALQKQKDLPVTGLPNYETIAALGLPPEKVFRPYQKPAAKPVSKPAGGPAAKAAEAPPSKGAVAPRR